MVPDHLKGCLVAFKCFDEQVRNFEAHWSAVAFDSEKVAHMIKIGECETETGPDDFVEIQVQLAQTAPTVHGVFQ